MSFYAPTDVLIDDINLTSTVMNSYTKQHATFFSFQTLLRYHKTVCVWIRLGQLSVYPAAAAGTGWKLALRLEGLYWR
jgi:hypothetical protein